MAKKKKSTKTKTQTPFDIGLEEEQKLADSLCNKFENKNDDSIDDAFIGSFQGLSHRMLSIFKKEFVFELLSDMANLVEEGHGEHVCNDCRNAGMEVPVNSKVDNSKLH